MSDLPTSVLGRTGATVTKLAYGAMELRGRMPGRGGRDVSADDAKTILNAVLDTAPNVRVFLLDGHNEFARCFGARANVIHPQNLKLPFWLFNFEEFIDVVFGGRPAVEEELEILSEHIPIAKGMYLAQRAAQSDRFGLRKVDSPVQKGAHGELAGLRESRATSHCEFHNVPKNHGRPVGGDFDNVVGGVGIRFGEVGDDNFIDAG